MNTGVISKRYAKALLNLCIETRNGDAVYKQAQMILNNEYPRKLEPELKRFIDLLIDNNRLPYVNYMLSSFIGMWAKHSGIVEVKLTLAIEDPELEEKVRKDLSALYSGQIIFNKIIDPKIIGGYILEVDDKSMDTSVKSRINTIRRSLDDLNKRLI